MDSHVVPHPAPGGRKLRLLALHSYRTSAAIFKEQLRRSKLDVQLDDLIELVYIDAPFAASGKIPIDVAPYFDGPYYEWVKVEQQGDRIVADDDMSRHSIAFIGKVLLEQGPFDGLIGFSQGAVMASSLIAMQRHGTALQDVPMLRMCVLFAGMKIPHPAYADAMIHKVHVPSIHIFGDKDNLREQCKELAEAFSSSVTLQHPRGHIVAPLVDYQLMVLRAFLASCLHSAAVSTRM